MTLDLDAFYAHNTVRIPTGGDAMRGVRWALEYQPAYREHVQNMCAYLAVEAALMRQGREVPVRAVLDSPEAGKVHEVYDEVIATIREMLRRSGVVAERIHVDYVSSKLRVAPDTCVHCDADRDHHVNGACLFQSTRFLSRYPVMTVVDVTPTAP